MEIDEAHIKVKESYETVLQEKLLNNGYTFENESLKKYEKSILESRQNSIGGFDFYITHCKFERRRVMILQDPDNE